MNFKKVAAIVTIVSSLFTTLSVQAFAAPSHNRISGSDRYGTSTAISKMGWQGTSEFAVIAYGGDFPDALSAAPLAKKYDAPIFLTSKDSLDSNSKVSDIKVSEELKRLEVNKVFIVGGPASVSEKVEREIEAIDTKSGRKIEIERVSGKNRFLTALEVAKEVGTENGIVVTTGMKAADALSVSPIAAAKGMPIILVKKDAIDEDVRNYLDGQDYLKKEGSNEDSPKAYIVGGNAAVDSSIENQFANKKRISGSDAYETNMKILSEFEADLDYRTVFIASRNSFADALAGSALASVKVPSKASPIILTGDSPGKATVDFIKSNIDSIGEIQVLGGVNAVKPDALQKLVLDSIELREILDANLKTMGAKSMESKSEISLKVSAEGLPKDMQDELNAMLSSFGDMKVNINTKTDSNDDKTIVRSAVDMLIEMPDNSFDTGFWVDIDMSGVTPTIREIVKVPSVMADTLPEELAGKEYMVTELSDLEGEVPAEQMLTMDYNELLQVNKEFQEQLVQLINKYIEEGANNTDFVVYKGEEAINTEDGSKNAKVYEINMDNAALEELLTYLGAEDELVSMIKDLDILGDKGIKLNYYIIDGFIAAQKGTIDLQVDLEKLGAILGPIDPVAEEEVQGVLKLQLIIDAENFNINKDVQIDLPVLNEDNSFNYSDLLGLMPQDEFSMNDEDFDVFDEDYVMTDEDFTMFDEDYTFIE